MTDAPRADQTHPASLQPLRIIAAVSGIYDVLLGLAMLAGRDLLVRLFHLPPPVPPVHADLNGLFLLVIGVGYVFPCRRPDAWRAYLWLMGPVLKGTGAALFVADHFVRHSPDSFLLFALSDGSLALVTLWALLRTGRLVVRPPFGKA